MNYIINIDTFHRYHIATVFATHIHNTHKTFSEIIRTNRVFLQLNSSILKLYLCYSTGGLFTLTATTLGDVNGIHSQQGAVSTAVGSSSMAGRVCRVELRWKEEKFI